MEKLYNTIIASRYVNDKLYANKIDTNQFDKLIIDEEDTNYCLTLTIPLKLSNLDIQMKHNLKMVCQELSELSNDSCYIYYPECQLFIDCNNASDRPPPIKTASGGSLAGLRRRNSSAVPSNNCRRSAPRVLAL